MNNSNIKKTMCQTENNSKKNSSIFLLFLCIKISNTMIDIFRKNILIIVGICCFLRALEAQQLVAGRITDATDGMPVASAAIFIAHSSIGTTSDESGNYSLRVPGRGSFEIAVSHVGYQSVFHKIDTPQSFHQYDVALEVSEMQEVIISAPKTYRPSDVDLFWLKILGEKPSKRGLEVIHPEKVYFYLTQDNVLKVSCREPIDIVNHEMGYYIRYVLQSFEHDYRNGETTFYGMPYFAELSPQNNRQKNSWEKKRQKVYAVTGFSRRSTIVLSATLPVEYAARYESRELFFDPLLATGNSVPENLALQFHHQLTIFPQEKIYMHIDKTVCITGEKLWFRTYLVNAANHIPVSGSQYVYVELFNPLDSLLSRVKIRNNSGAYHGYMDIPQDIPEGDYTLRAYTHYMRNLDEHYISARTVHIGNSKNMLHVETKFSFDGEGATNADFSFFNAPKGAPVVPKSVQMSINGGNVQHLDVAAEGTTGVNFRMPLNASRRVMLLEVNDPVYPCRKFIQIPASDHDFDVSFYPEGGSLLQGVSGRVAFKAMKSNGRPAKVEGVIYDQHGKEYGRIRSDEMGMGSFEIFSEEGVSCHVVCTNDQQQRKRFDLPAALKTGYALTVNNMRDDRIYVSVLKSAPDNRRDTLYLLAHMRGVVYYSEQWDADRTVIALPKKELPSGVLHLVLYDAALNPVSERLAFINNGDQAQVAYENDQKSFAARSLVNNRIALTDRDGNPLSGSFSVSVVDNQAVVTDTTSNILTYLLLTSDLRGNIDNPAAYFANNRSTDWSLELLMMTQGWRRYDVGAIAQGRLARPEIPLELSAEISGTVKGGLTYNNLLEKAKVSIVSSNESYFELMETDSEGRFRFKGCDLPDSTTFWVRAANLRNNTNVMLDIDEATYPEWTLPVVAPAAIEQETVQKYVEQATPKEEEEKKKEKEEEYKWDLGEMKEVAITGKRPIPKSVFRATYHLDEDQIKDINKHHGINALLEQIPNVTIVGGNALLYVNISKGRAFPFNKLIIDDQINEPLVYESLLYEMLELIDPGKVKSIYKSDIHVLS